MATTISIFAILFYYFLLVDHVYAYYGDLYNKTFAIPTLLRGVTVAVQDTIYILGGIQTITEAGVSFNITTLQFDSQQNAITNTITNDTALLNMFYSHGYSLGDNKTIVLANVQYPNVSITNAQGNVTDRYTSGIAFYDIPSNTWAYPHIDSAVQPLPPLTVDSMSAISPENDAIYMMGGYYIDYETILPSIYRYDLKNTSSIINMTAIDPNLKIDAIYASSNMLPDGIIVIAFGMASFSNETLLDASQVTLFDTRKNQIYTQPVSGIPPPSRFAAGSALGPDKSTIYYYGGGDQAAVSNAAIGKAVPNLVALDTTTWTWIHPNVSGQAAVPYFYSTLTLFENTKLVAALGWAGSAFTEQGWAGSAYENDIGVIQNVPQYVSELQDSNMQWFTNNEELDIYSNPEYSRIKQALSQGAVAGTTTAVLLIIILLMALLWRRRIRMIGLYIHNEIIWQPRSGEPLWAEAARLMVRFILLFFLSAFVVYSIYRSIDSPVVVQEFRESTSVVRAPDVRFCLNGFNSSNPLTPLNVTCSFSNGTDCSSQVLKLDMAKHTPRYQDFLGLPTCFMFVSSPEYSFINAESAYSQVLGTKMTFSINGPPNRDSSGNITSVGLIYINMYAPDYNPNVKAYQLAIPTKVGLDEYRQWKLDEQDANLVNTIIVDPGVRSTALYDIIKRRILHPNDGWNNVGFSSNYDETFAVDSFYRDVPQNLAILIDSSLLAQITIQPSSFTINTSIEQKVFTLLNAFAQIGGILGLFVAVQTVLFGFRPSSPFGIVHRWSFGRLRNKLTDRLASYFNRMGTPVPLVNPVRKRPGTVSENNAIGSGSLTVVEAISQESRVNQLEERLQLMELLLKSYYLNDEVFRTLDQAVKRGNNQEESSITGSIERKSTISNESNDMLELTTDIKPDEDSASTAGIRWTII